MAWKPVVRPDGEGEKILFKVGLMTFKATSAETDGQFAFIETILPPGASVEPHQHPEAEVFYILDGQFTFWIGDEPGTICDKGAFLSVPPQVRHAYHNHTNLPGKILGMLAPGGDGGLETFFRQVGVPLSDGDEAPDLTRPVAVLHEEIARRRNKDRSQMS
ncbi:quercetin dioxygenase-like cupin family protein [Neorhizobium sp. 2083]|uniref:cupin domain-containing protein n=1 Tax=Neorhizobium sp. 2083 TaxID=2817762 RepID=UPI00285D27C4|nr:cupin domain-containing protein [Neorhizobium sp. 2083]MDR6819039.1 quercetin dioxygenase-like cupin family protein [Neorhizobium sp. 2083]